jgi:predicted glycosyltransferase
MLKLPDGIRGRYSKYIVDGETQESLTYFNTACPYVDMSVDKNLLDVFGIDYKPVYKDYPATPYLIVLGLAQVRKSKLAKIKKECNKKGALYIKQLMSKYK